MDVPRIQNARPARSRPVKIYSAVAEGEILATWLKCGKALRVACGVVRFETSD